jgi:hypothetical protein
LEDIRRAIQSRLGHPQDPIYTQISTGDSLDVISKTRGRQATNPCDQIYAILGLLHVIGSNKVDIQHTLEADYTKSHWIVYQEATRFVIEVEDSLEVLQFRGHTACTDIPSWVPDYGAPISKMYPTLQRKRPCPPWFSSYDCSERKAVGVSQDLKTLLC